MVLYYPRHSQNQRGIAVRRPSQEKGQASKARTTESAHTSERTTYGYIDSLARLTLAHSLQLTIR